MYSSETPWQDFRQHADMALTVTRCRETYNRNSRKSRRKVYETPEEHWNLNSSQSPERTDFAY